MKSTSLSVNDYLQQVPEERRPAFQTLREICQKNLKGFEECMSYGMVGYVVPMKDYPAGYHCAPNTPLPFVNLASQKNFIALYHMGLYADTELLDWFVKEYPNHAKGKLDMGKSCIRFKKPDDIPFKLIEQLMKKMDSKKWIGLYEKLYAPKKKGK